MRDNEVHDLWSLELIRCNAKTNPGAVVRCGRIAQISTGQPGASRPSSRALINLENLSL